MTVNQNVPTFVLLALACAAPTDCTCCAGGIEGAWEDLCQGCAVGIVNKTRGEGHPHAPSPAQQAIIDQDGPVGGGVTNG